MPWTCLARSANARHRGPDRVARRSPSLRPPAPATCPWTRSGRTDRDRRTGRRQAATTCRRPSAAPPRRGPGPPGGRLVKRLGRGYACGTTANSERACMAALRAASHKHAASRCGRPGRSAQALSPARPAAQSRRWQRLAGTITCTAVRGRPVLRCSGRANHHDPVTPSNLPGGKPGSGPPPGRDVGSGSTWAGPPGSAVQPTRPKGDPR
jgi:hypothetical protein